MLNLGVIRPGSIIRIPFNSFDKDDGSAITMTNFAVSDILIYKDGSTTERASTSGFTATTDFDAKTGKHVAIIDLADNTTAGFYAAGSEYLVGIDSVTVDAVTTGGWIARFQIGHTDEWYSTTIATLASQTSFTLTTGPAEDNALTGQWVILHDIASAVQCSRGVISAYTGSTKTVTLAAAPTFTIAVGDNISIMEMAPLQPTVMGRALDVSTGGEAGVDWANVGSPTTSLALTGTTIAVTQKVDVDTIKTNPVVNAGTITFPTTATLASTTNITAGTITTATNVTTVNGLAANVITAAATAADFGAELATAIWTDTTAGDFTVAASIGKSIMNGVALGTGLTINAYTGNTVQTGDSFARIGVNGAGLTNIDLPNQTMDIVGNITGNLSGSVGSVTGLTASNLDATISSRATPAQVNAEVLDVLNVDTFSEPTGVPAATTTLAGKIGRIYQALRNKVEVSATKKTFYDDADAALWEKDLSDDGTTYQETEGNSI